MRTPSLERRAVRAGITAVVAIVVALEVSVFFTVRQGFEDNLDEALTLRQELAQDVAAITRDPQQLADGLARLGVPVVVTDPDGRVVEVTPEVLRSRPGEALPISTVARPREGRSLTLDDGTLVTVYASRAGTDEALRRLLLVSLGGTVAALASASFLLRRASRFALEPLDQVVAAAARTAEGRTGERLRPDDPTTELGRLAVAYDHMLDELETALQEAQDSDERSRRFLADAAHQLRTPMASIRAAVELLLTDPGERLREQHLSHLVRETRRGTRVLNSLLTLARLDRGRSPDCRPTDLDALVDDELERAASLAPQLAITRTGSAGSRLNLDGDALREALANLLDNARRHAHGHIDVTVERKHARVEVLVTDDGPGVPVGARGLVFERFATLDGKGGSGLGLPVARAIVEAHGGTLVHDDGFRITLPAESPP